MARRCSPVVLDWQGSAACSHTWRQLIDIVVNFNSKKSLSNIIGIKVQKTPGIFGVIQRPFSTNSPFPNPALFIFNLTWIPNSEKVPVLVWWKLVLGQVKFWITSLNWIMLTVYFLDGMKSGDWLFWKRLIQCKQIPICKVTVLIILHLRVLGKVRLLPRLSGTLQLQLPGLNLQGHRCTIFFLEFLQGTVYMFSPFFPRSSLHSI